MITLCIASNYPAFEQYLLPSIQKLTGVSEVIICYQDESLVRPDEKMGDITIKRCCVSGAGIYAHAICLQEAFRRARTKYVLLCDADVVFLDDATKMYLEIVESGIDFAGVQHYVLDQCYDYFPCVINFFGERKKFPPEDYLKGYLKTRKHLKVSDDDTGTLMDGYWLLQTPIPEFQEQFPHVHGKFDIGCNLWLWSNQQGYRWVSWAANSDGTTYSMNDFKNSQGWTYYNPSINPFLYHETARKPKISNVSTITMP